METPDQPGNRGRGGDRGDADRGLDRDRHGSRAERRAAGARSVRSQVARAAALLIAVGLAGGCAYLSEKQGELIFRPSKDEWRGFNSYKFPVDEHWIPVGQEQKLHAWWLAGDNPKAPAVLYLHGARWNLTGSVTRIDRWRQLGFAVLAVDYRGFGKSTKELPSEESAREDARAAWAWLAARHPEQRRYIFGHSLGGAIGIDLAAHVKDESGTIVEGTFTSISDVVSSFKWGWLPFGPFITQRFESLTKVKDIGAPLLVVHGALDNLIRPELGRKLYDAATVPKLFVLVKGGSHHSTNTVGELQYKAALEQFFLLKPPALEPPTLTARQRFLRTRLRG